MLNPDPDHDGKKSAGVSIGRRGSQKGNPIASHSSAHEYNFEQDFPDDHDSETEGVDVLEPEVSEDVCLPGVKSGVGKRVGVV